MLFRLGTVFHQPSPWIKNVWPWSLSPRTERHLIEVCLSFQEFCGSSDCLDYSSQFPSFFLSVCLLPPSQLQCGLVRMRWLNSWPVKGSWRISSQMSSRKSNRAGRQITSSTLFRSFCCYLESLHFQRLLFFIQLISHFSSLIIERQKCLEIYGKIKRQLRLLTYESKGSTGILKKICGLRKSALNHKGTFVEARDELLPSGDDIGVPP